MLSRERIAAEVFMDLKPIRALGCIFSSGQETLLCPDLYKNKYSLTPINKFYASGDRSASRLGRAGYILRAARVSKRAAPKAFADGGKDVIERCVIYAQKSGRLITYALNVSNLWGFNSKQKPTSKDDWQPKQELVPIVNVQNNAVSNPALLTEATARISRKHMTSVGNTPE